MWVDGWSQIISTYIVFLIEDNLKIETERILEKGEDVIANWETTWKLRLQYQLFRRFLCDRDNSWLYELQPRLNEISSI